MIKNEKVKKFKIIIDYPVKDFNYYMFYECFRIVSVNFMKCHRTNISNMESMLNDCSSIKKINLSNWKINNVINMR